MRRLLALLSVTLVCGCLSIVRVPFPANELYSDDGVCTNRTWVCFYDGHPEWRVYPTIKMRCYATWQVYFDDSFYLDRDGNPLKGEKLYQARMTRRWCWLPLTVMWLTSPIDAAVDTVFLPWDLYVRHTSSNTEGE